MSDLEASEFLESHLLSGLGTDPDFDETWDMGPPGSAPDVRGIPDEEAVELIVAWFRDNFEDPANHMPHDEGAYIYIWGGPYYADQEIEDTFPDLSDAARIAAIDEIESDGYEWAPANSRLVRELPRDRVIRAKQRAYWRIKNWCELEADAKTNPESVKITFYVEDVGVLLQELARLQEIVDRKPA